MNQTKLIGIIIGSIFGSLLIILSIIRIFINSEDQENKKLKDKEEQTTRGQKQKASKKAQEEKKKRIKEQIQEKLIEVKKIQESHNNISTKLKKFNNRSSLSKIFSPDKTYEEKLQNSYLQTQTKLKKAGQELKNLQQELNQAPHQQGNIVQGKAQNESQQQLKLALLESINNTIEGLGIENHMDIRYLIEGFTDKVNSSNKTEKNIYLAMFNNSKKWFDKELTQIEKNIKNLDEDNNYFSKLAGIIVSYLYWILRFNIGADSRIKNIINNDIDFIFRLWNNLESYKIIEGFDQSNKKYIINNEILNNIYLKNQTKINSFINVFKNSVFKAAILRIFRANEVINNLKNFLDKNPNYRSTLGGKITKKQRKTRKNKK